MILRPLARLIAAGSLAVLPALGARRVALDVPVFEGGYGIGFYQDTARRFEALNPGVSVHVYGNPRIQDQVRIRIIDGDLPDAASVPYILWSTLVRAGKMVDLSPYLGGANWEGDARWGDTFQPGSLDSWRVDGGVYGLPMLYSCWSLFYNRALFREHGWVEPRTWDEFFALCDRIRAAGSRRSACPGRAGSMPTRFSAPPSTDWRGPPAGVRSTSLRPGRGRTRGSFARRVSWAA